MTFRELLKREHPECINESYGGGCEGCPHEYGYEAENVVRPCSDGSMWETADGACAACWDRKIPGYDPAIEYWSNISALNERQTAKGIEKYGVRLEDNTTLSREQRVEHVQEELIDALKYLEHLKTTFADSMTANDYQRMAMRTSGEYDNSLAMIRDAVYGLNGEAGEIIDLLKKHEFQGHDLPEERLVEELGDVLWYCALLADALGFELEEVMRRNIEKLKARYPDGFDKDRSINRTEG